MSVRRQGSSSYVIVIAGAAFILVGAMVLTFVMFPYINTFTGAAFFQADSAPGGNLTAVVAGLWRFSPFIFLLMLSVYIWIETRQ